MLNKNKVISKWGKITENDNGELVLSNFEFDLQNEQEDDVLVILKAVSSRIQKEINLRKKQLGHV